MGNSEFRIGNWGAATLVGFVVATVLFCDQTGIASTEQPEFVELIFDLPEAFFSGTPIDWFSPNLEAKDFKERSPFMAPVGTKIISLKKPVTSSRAPIRGKLEQAVDGNKNHEEENAVEFPKGLQWVQVDFQEEFQLYAILLWHYHHGERVYFDVIGQVSNDPDFKDGVTQFYNNDYDNSSGLGKGTDKEYFETSKGRLFDLQGLRGRYIRFYSQGNMFTDTNHVVEIEVWGKEPSSREVEDKAPIDIELPEAFFGGLPF